MEDHPKIPQNQVHKYLKENVYVLHEALRKVVKPFYPKVEVRQGHNNTWVLLYSSRYVYSISCRSNYLGAHKTLRKNLAGETHHRSRDLPDGPMTEDVANEILYAILNSELQELGTE